MHFARRNLVEFRSNERTWRQLWYRFHNGLFIPFGDGACAAAVQPLAFGWSSMDEPVWCARSSRDMALATGRISTRSDFKRIDESRAGVSGRTVVAGAEAAEMEAAEDGGESGALRRW
jgi:hypothetical protein